MEAQTRRGVFIVFYFSPHDFDDHVRGLGGMLIRGRGVPKPAVNERTMTHHSCSSSRTTTTTLPHVHQGNPPQVISENFRKII